MYRGNPRLTGVVQGRGPHHLHGVKWHLKAPVFAISSLAAAQHMLYFGGSDGSLFAVDAEQGTVQWQFELSHPPSFCPVHYTPAIEQGIVYYPVAGEQGSFLYVIDAQTGQEVSHFTGMGLEAVDALTGEHKWSRPYALIGPPTVTDNLIFISFPAPFVEHDHVFIVSNQGVETEETYIYALH